MHEEPLLLIPVEARKEVLASINEKLPDGRKIKLYGDVCPFCRKIQGDLMELYDGDWKQDVIDHVVRAPLNPVSEKDRRGIGTFQPKDEKNQDSTELTGDLNYRKIAEYGSDSDPRAFNFDGELNIANRGIVEFIEVLKLDVAFLYDLLGASQEHMIKPKKFAQTYIDEVILGSQRRRKHTDPLPARLGRHRLDDDVGAPRASLVTTVRGLEVLAHDFRSGHDAVDVGHAGCSVTGFTGTMLTTSQKWGAVETTPNHSIYGRDGKPHFSRLSVTRSWHVRKLGGVFAAERARRTYDRCAGKNRRIRPRRPSRVTSARRP